MIKKNILNYFNKSPRHGQKASASQIVGFSDWTDEKRTYELPSSLRRNAQNVTNDQKAEKDRFRVRPRARVTSARLSDPLSFRQESDNDHEGARATKRRFSRDNGTNDPKAKKRQNFGFVHEPELRLIDSAIRLRPVNDSSTTTKAHAQRSEKRKRF